jgi:hypothetical protein
VPRSRRGGRRSGTPGKAYSQRTDLQRNPGPNQPIRTATGQPYGVAQQQREAQQAVPLPQAPPPPKPRAAPVQTAPLPGELPPLNAPTDRPSEPLTAGIPFGPGPGPEVLNVGVDPVLLEAREVYRVAPDEDLREAIAVMEAEGRG